MSYSLATLWHERQRYVPGVLAVGFSALLIALQCGLLLGLFSITSIPVDHTRADIWVGAPEVLSVDLGRPVPESYLLRLANQPGVRRVRFPGLPTDPGHEVARRTMAGYGSLIAIELADAATARGCKGADSGAAGPADRAWLDRHR